MIDGQQITIIGAGIAGLASAVALAQRGARVRVLEQAEQISEVGAGLQVTPNGVAVLDGLGLGERLRAVAQPAGAVVLRDYRRGAQVARLDMSRGVGGRPYLLAHRADLIALLADAARSAGVSLECGQQVSAVREVGERVRITLANGDSETPGLLVGADGLHSRLRGFLNGTENPFFTGQVAWRALVDGPGPGSVTVTMAPGQHLVAYPLRGGRLTNIVAIQERSDWAEEGWQHPGDVAELRRAFSRFCPDVQALLSRVEAANIWGLFRHPVAAKWHGDGCVLVGDAAHSTLPFLAQGANMALEDGWVLAECLAGQPVQDALASFQQQRRARVARIVAAADANARAYHLANPLLRFAAHSGLRLASAVAPGQLLGRFDWVYRHDVTVS